MKNENLEQLLNQFMNQADSERSLRDIRVGDSLFDENPAPSVNERVIESINSQVRLALQKQKQQRFISQLSAAAALIAVALLSGLYVLSTSKPSVSNQYLASNAQNFWAQTALHDEVMSRIENELADVAQSITDIESDDSHALNTPSIDLLELEELELMAASNDFWKG